MPQTVVHLPQYPDASITLIRALETASPAGKLADVEITFHAGILSGLRLVGFMLWEKRSASGRRNVTYPARTYSVNGERRSFALLRPATLDESAYVVGVPTAAQDRLTALIVDAYAIAEQQLAAV